MYSASIAIGTVMSCLTKRKLECVSSGSTFCRLPVTRLSTATTENPSFSSRAHKWLPRKPAPPVTTARPAGDFPGIVVFIRELLTAPEQLSYIRGRISKTRASTGVHRHAHASRDLRLRCVTFVGAEKN